MPFAGCLVSRPTAPAICRRCPACFRITKPVVHNHQSGREMVKMRWGMPPPPKFGGPPVTNLRNLSSPHWRGWPKPENRCLVPASSFSEYAPEPDPVTKKEDVVWFALDKSRPCSHSPASGLNSRASAAPNRSRSGAASGLWVFDDRTERGGGAHSPESHAGHSDE